MPVTIAMTSSQGLTIAALVVVGFCLVASSICLYMAVRLVLSDEVKKARALLKDAQRQQTSHAAMAGEPVDAFDPEGWAKLADALQHLDPAGRFLLFAFGFAASAAFAAGVSAIGNR